MTAWERSVRWSGRHAVVTLPAEIDVTNSADVGEVLAAVAAEHPELITADLTGTSFCDSSGVHAIARGYRLAAQNGGELRLAVGSSPTLRVLELTGLDQVVSLYPDVEQSLATPPAAGRQRH